ncbi:uncharacterized protein N7484_001326 [Penicillium longicatenatum]|uniref:uncharacterized protein n=1 Tax=Penicillium longicatenatum TaxID=1561947 RepID=UPI0025465D7C|nr:uncharacterized protein N7484_001326 [Penicillium longicatenatum]KAJ5657677.1 hypothetical protein N7484_001326 [Penicillium longicatenatum]
MFRTKSQKIKQKQKEKERQSSVSSGVGYNGTKNSSSSTLPVQSSDLKGAMDSTPSLVTPESKPEAPVLSEPEPEPEPNIPVSSKQAVSTLAPAPTLTPPLPQSAPTAPSEPVASIRPEETVTAPVFASASASPPKQASVAFEPPKHTPPKLTAFVEPEPEPAANSPPLSIPSESRPIGGRRGKSDDDANGTTKGGELVAGNTGGISNAGLQIPGQLLNEDEKSALKIKIHLNLHAKVRLDLDAQIYGDVVIGLL